MGFATGEPLPSTTVTTSKADVAPQYYTDYLAELGKAATAATGKTAADGIAAYDPLQTLGYGKVETGAESYKPGLTAAETSIAGLTGGLDTGRITELMNPYTQNVVDEMARLSQQNVQRNVMPSLMASFVGSGGLGGQRYAGALGQTMADVQSGLTGQQYGALSKGYSEALQAALKEQEDQIQATKLQGELAARAQELGLTEAGALTKAGSERQAYEQAKLDYPLSQATKAAALLRGYNIPMTQTETRTGPLSRDYYGTSGLQDLTSISALIGSAGAGKAGSLALDALKSLSPDVLKDVKDYLLSIGQEPLDWMDIGGDITPGTYYGDSSSDYTSGGGGGGSYGSSADSYYGRID